MSAIELLLELEDAFHHEDWIARVRGLCAPDLEFIDVGPGIRTGIDGFIEVELTMMRAWSNVRTRQLMLVGDDTSACIELEVMATHSGPLQWHGHSFAATGRDVSMLFARCISVSDHSITSIRDYFNDVSFMRQHDIPVQIADVGPVVI